MAWLQFLAVSLVIVVAGVRLARFGDVIGEKSGLGRNWIGVVLLAATTSLPELFTGFGATALARLPDIAVGDVLGSCMFNLLILSLMDAIQPEPLSARAHQGHALAIGFGLVLTAITGFGLLGGAALPVLGWVGLSTPVLAAVYVLSMRLVFRHEQHRRAREVQEVASQLQYAAVSTRAAVGHYATAAVLVIGAATVLPRLGATIADQTGLGQAFVGSLLIAVTTSLPEIVVSVAAVRMGAVELGIANILGSNLFNMLILGLDDVFYRDGALLASVDAVHAVSLFGVVAMYGLFLAGLSYRALTKRFAVAWDTAAMAAVYVAAVSLSYLMRG
ncbi:MAG: sodium:calcium antiporter [Vicinamibacterales bacterium]